MVFSGIIKIFSFIILEIINIEEFKNLKICCANCQKLYDFMETIPKIVPCEHKHIFCE